MDGSWSEEAFHTSVLMLVPHTQGIQVRGHGLLPLGPICSAQDKAPLGAGEVCQKSGEIDFTILVGLAVGCGGPDSLLFGALLLVSGCFTVFGNFSKLGKSTAWLRLLCSWVRRARIAQEGKSGRKRD